MLLLNLLSSVISVSQPICLYDTSTALCPHDATKSYSIHNWDAYRNDEGNNFGLNGNINLTYYLCTNLSEHTPIELRLPAAGDHNVTFRAVGPEGIFGLVFLEDSVPRRARHFRFYNCFIRVMTEGAIYFEDLLLQHSQFLEANIRLYAHNSLSVDLFSATFLPTLSASSVTLLFPKPFWPLFPEVIHLSRLVTINNFTIGGIDRQMTLRIFGDMYVFGQAGSTVPVYVNIQEVITRPRVLLNREGGHLTVFCDYYVPKFYEPPVIEFELSTNEPLVFGNSQWPIWFPNLVLVTTRGRAGQNLWINTPEMPVTIKTYWNISETFEPVGDIAFRDEYLSELTIGTDLPDVTILGQIQTQASDVHFDSHVRNRASLLTIVDFLEYGMRLSADSLLDKGVAPKIVNPNLTVQFVIHDKHESLNTSSAFGGVGHWKWLSFPFSQSSTRVGNLLVNSNEPYQIYYGHHWYGSLGSALCELDPVTEGQSTITFSHPENRLFRLEPHYYFNEYNRPSNDELDHSWAVGKEDDNGQPIISGYPALIYFHDVSEHFEVHIDVPDYGAPGFESSTFFFDFVWDDANRAIRMVKKHQLKVSDFNYRFCWALDPTNASTICPRDYAVISGLGQFTSFVKPTARTLRIALAGDLDYDFSYFTSTQINVRIFTPNAARTGSRKLIVPPSFLAGSKFGEIHLHNVTLAFHATQNPKIELSEIVHLDLHNVSFDVTVINSLQDNGCRDTPYIQADPSSYALLQDHCVPDYLRLDEGTYERLEFSPYTLSLYHSNSRTLRIVQTGGRPYEIDIEYHANQLQLDVTVGTAHIPKTNIWMPDIPGNRTFDDLPNYTFGSNWNADIAGNLTIDNLLGRFYISTRLVPFRPGGFIRVPPAGPTGIRIYPHSGVTIPDARVYYPFPNHARLNVDSYGVVLRYQDIELLEPMTPTGNIESAIFAGKIKFDQGSGINIVNLEFDRANPPTLNIDFRLQGGLPRLYLGTVHSPVVLPTLVNFTHRGASEKQFIQSHLDFFRGFSHEIICGNASLGCQRWNIVFSKNNTEDATNHHDHGTSILRAICRPQVQGLLGECLALELDEYYFPFPTFPPTPTAVPHPHPSPTPHSGSDSGQSTFTSNSGIGKGVGIGIGVGAILAVGAVGGIFWWFRKRPQSKGYDTAGYDSATYTTP